MAESQASPRRVHDLELLVGALSVLARGPTPEDEIYKRLRTRARTLGRRRIGSSDGNNLDEPGGLAKGTVREVLRELQGFGLAQRVTTAEPQLTSDGQALAKQFAYDSRSAKGLRQLAALHLGRFPNLRRLLTALERAPSGLIFIPRPTPVDLGIPIHAREIEAYRPYVEAAAEYTASELRAWGIKGVRSTSVLAVVRRAAMARDESYRRGGRSWTNRIMIDTIRDALARFSLAQIVPTLGVVDFEIYCSRGSSVGLLNYTDRLDGAHGRVVFATSWSDHQTVPTWVSARSLRPIEYRQGGREHSHLIHDPRWSVIRGRFLRELQGVYQQLNAQKRTLYVRIADVRDLVCYRLRISDASFDQLLTRVYHETMNDEIDSLRISFEADEIKEARGSQVSKRNPLYLRGRAPRTMISVLRRRR